MLRRIAGDICLSASVAFYRQKGAQRIGRFRTGGMCPVRLVGDMPLELQPKQVACIAEAEEFERPGSNKIRRTGMLNAAATNRDLKNGRRIVSSLQRSLLPPEGIPDPSAATTSVHEDIPPLAKAFTQTARRLGAMTGDSIFLAETLRTLSKHGGLGNHAN